MNPIQVSQDIVPLGNFKSQASRILRRLREKDRPIIITQYGKPAAVLLTPQEFDRLTERQRFVEAVQEGLQDSAAGRVIDDVELRLDLLP
jgi:prevent-host-death family protein